MCCPFVFRLSSHPNSRQALITVCFYFHFNSMNSQQDKLKRDPHWDIESNCQKTKTKKGTWSSKREAAYQVQGTKKKRFCWFKKLDSLFFYFWVLRVGFKSFVSYVICKYFPTIYRPSFYSLNSVCRAEVLNFDKV